MVAEREAGYSPKSGQSMTKEEIKAKKERFKQNDLYQKSTSPYKDFQFEQFSANGKVLVGNHSRTDTIDGKNRLVIFNFKNGLIHSENGLPAIEYLNHWEYWENGLITKVVDVGKKYIEHWNDGVPVHIAHTDILH